MQYRSLSPLVFLSAAILILPLTVPAQDVALADSEGSLSYNISVPSFEFKILESGKTRILMPGADYGLEPGLPNLPTLSYTFALPPGTKADRIEVSGARGPLEGKWDVETQPLPLPLAGSSCAFLESMYRDNQEKVLVGQTCPQELGRLVTSSNRREYSLATIVLYPVSYDPADQKLSSASDLSVTIHYSPIEADGARLVKEFIDAGTLDADVPPEVFNKDQARTWYRPGDRLSAKPGLLIITTGGLLTTLESYIGWRESQGYTVKAISKEKILGTNVTGVDLQEKIRNWLRLNAAKYQYLLIVAHNNDIPMRTLHGYGNDPSQDPGWYYPAISDVYYGDISLADNYSWDADGDRFYGEVLPNGSGPNVDKPDLAMELHVGRINTSDASRVKKILDKIQAFETTSEQEYKKNAVVSAGIPFYPRSVSDSGLDGAIFMEYLQDAEILDRSLTTTLYETGGDLPTKYECDLPETHDNLVSTLKNTNAGVFVEYNHGSPTTFARFIVHDNNGDGYFQDGEEEWFTCLSTGDAWNLNSEHPTVAFLMSCVNGRPEEQPVCLAQSLLNYGSVATVAHTRVSYSGGWHTPANGGFECLFYEDIKAFAQDGKTLGEAVSNARPVLREKEPDWFFLNGYTHVLFGDPLLKLIGIPAAAIGEEPIVQNKAHLKVGADNTVCYALPAEGYARIEVWDVSGRKVSTLLSGSVAQGPHQVSLNSTGLATGTYFVTLRAQGIVLTAKAVITK